MPPNSELAWEHPLRNGGMVYHLYKTTWDNPYPERIVDHLDYVSTKTAAAPLIVALTTE